MTPAVGGQRSRRATALVISGIALLALLAVALLLPVPYVRLAPGPVFNTIGEHDGEPVIQVSGAPTYPTDGNLDMTTVSESGGPRGGLTLFQAVAGWFNASDAVLPRELLYPDDVTGEQVQRENAAAFSTSQADAVAAAANYLKLPTTPHVVVTAVTAGSPAEGNFDGGDWIDAVDGVPVTSSEQVGKAVRAKPIGTTFRFRVTRDGKPTEVTVTSAANPDDPSKPYVGISVGTIDVPEFSADFTLQDIGGPSAGQMFALGIIDKLTPGDLTGGRHIAGTGTITPDGRIGPIGGIRQKLAGARAAGAELFLMPKVHCDEAAGHVPDGLTVVPVETLTDSVNAIEAWKAGRPLPTCPAPGA